ncbi:MAG: DinB family protein [Acidobacteriota bacterium]
MAEEAWLSGKLDSFSDVLMPTAHALVQAISDLNKVADLTVDELLTRPNGSPSVAFHLRHIAGSCERLLTYAKGESLSESHFDFLKRETVEEFDLESNALVYQATVCIEKVLEFCKDVSPEILFEARFVGRKKLPTNIFGLLFHIAEHTARHVGQVITTARIVKKN